MSKDVSAVEIGNGQVTIHPALPLSISIESPETARVLLDIAQERERQVAKGWTPEYDDAHDDEHLTDEAIRRLMNRPFPANMDGSERGDLVAIAALLIAAIERHDRNHKEN